MLYHIIRNLEEVFKYAEAKYNLLDTDIVYYPIDASKFTNSLHKENVSSYGHRTYSMK